MKKKQSFEPKKYIVDEETKKVSIVVNGFMQAMGSSNWCGRYYPDYECQFVSEDRYQLMKEERAND